VEFFTFRGSGSEFSPETVASLTMFQEGVCYDGIKLCNMLPVEIKGLPTGKTISGGSKRIPFC
jgi:hypothetical protein